MQTQLAQIEEQIEKVQAERDELDKKLPRGGARLLRGCRPRKRSWPVWKN